MVNTEAKAGFKRCSECLEIVPYRVKICPTCKSYQDWRRYVAIGQLNLALIIAVVSVMTTLLTVGVPFFTSRGADIRLLLETVNESGASFLARNDGRSGGTINVWRFELEAKPATSMRYHLLAHEPVYIEAGKEQRISIKEEGLKSFCSSFSPIWNKIQDTNSLFEIKEDGSTVLDDHFSCRFRGTQTSFYAPTGRDSIASFKCVQFLRACGMPRF